MSMQSGTHVRNIAGLGVLIGATMIATTAWAAPPAKQPTASVPVVVDSAGTIVGPVVPGINTDGMGQTTGGVGFTFDVAALYRGSGESGKIWFGGPQFPINATDFRNLQILGPFSLRFRQPGCQGQAYVDRSQLQYQEDLNYGYRGSLGRDLRGYGPLLVYPRAPGQTAPPFTPTIFRIEWFQPITFDYLDYGQASIFYPDGTCQDASFPGTLAWPVNFISTLNLVGPFSIK